MSALDERAPSDDTALVGVADADGASVTSRDGFFSHTTQMAAESMDAEGLRQKARLDRRFAARHDKLQAKWSERRAVESGPAEEDPLAFWARWGTDSAAVTSGVAEAAKLAPEEAKAALERLKVAASSMQVRPLLLLLLPATPTN